MIRQVVATGLKSEKIQKLFALRENNPTFNPDGYSEKNIGDRGHSRRIERP